MTTPKRQRRRVGDVVLIDLSDGHQAYARVLAEASFAVYDFNGSETVAVDAIVSRPILFIVAVMNRAVTKGRWVVVGNAPLDGSLAVLPPKFIQDPIDGGLFSIYEDGKMRPATREECLGLECAAVWDPSHVEDRIRDHFANRPNKWVESMRIKS